MFGDRLKQLRNQHKLTQQGLGEKLNLSQRVIGYYEKNERFPDQETLLKIADYFEVSLDYLLGRKNLYDENKDSDNVKSYTLNDLRVDYITDKYLLDAIEYEISKINDVNMLRYIFFMIYQLMESRDVLDRSDKKLISMRNHIAHCRTKDEFDEITKLLKNKNLD